MLRSVSIGTIPGLADGSTLKRMRAEDKTDMGGIQEAFLTTHWSLVESIDTSDDATRTVVWSGYCSNATGSPFTVICGAEATTMKKPKI